MLKYTKGYYFLFTVVLCAAIDCTAAVDSKIVNGSIAFPGEFPFMVRL